MNKTQVKVQKHADVAINRSKAILGEHFAICQRSIDVDGVDLLVQEIEESTDWSIRSSGAIYPGFVQVKFFQPKTQVRIDRSYVLTGNDPRPDFFVFLHSNVDNETRNHYFFTAEEVANTWSIGKNDKVFTFSVSNTTDLASVRNLSSKAIADKISSGIRKSRSQEFSGAVARFFRNRVDTRIMYEIEQDVEYLFFNVYGCSIVLYRLTESETTRLLEPRRDLFQYTGDFKWGYRGTGPQFLAASLLGHFLGGEWSQDQFDRTLELVSSQEKESNWKISTRELKAILEIND